MIDRGKIGRFPICIILNFGKQILKPAATIGVVPTNIRSVSRNQQQVLAWADIFLEW